MSDDASSLRHEPAPGAAAAPTPDSRLPASPRPCPEPRETSGMTTRLVLAYLERVGGRNAVVAVLRRAGLEDREEELRDESAWFSFDLKIRLFEAMVAVTGDQLATRRMGEAAVDMQVAAGLKVALRALGTPRLLYKNVVRANAKFSGRHAIELIDLRATSARMTFRDLDGGRIHPLDCEYTRGLLACAPRLFGLPAARVSHVCRAGEGTDSCTYDLSWDPERTRGVVAAGALAAVAVGASALLEPALLPASGTVAAIAAGFAALRLGRSRRARIHQMEAELSDFRDSNERISGSLRALVSELRLDEVLANVTSYARQAIGGKEFALLVDEPGGIRCQSSSGLPPRTVAALELWAREHAAGLDEPVLLDDVSASSGLEQLPEDPQMPLGSLCAAPLVYRGERLGLLVALSRQRLTFLPRDVARLQAYAMQAAIALTNARLYEAQEALATKDALTGLRNHREFHERVDHELERLRRHEGLLAIVLIDLDGFKSVNDESGHAAGDRVLRRAAAAIEGACRASDVAFRVGGDEFALILPGTGTEEAREVAMRVKAAVDAVDARTSASFGVAVWPDDGGSKDVLLAHADGGLYAAKSRGRGGSGALLVDGAAGERRLAVVNQLAARLAGAAGEEEIARATVDELDRSLGYVLASVLRADADGPLRVVACAGPLTREIDLHRFTQDRAEGVNGRVVRSGATQLVNDAALDPDHLDPERPGRGVRTALRSQLAVPIPVAGRVWGVLDLEDTRVGAFDNGDLLLAETIAAHVGAALHRSALRDGIATALRALAGELDPATARALLIELAGD